MHIGISSDTRANLDESLNEVVERKGAGHPDTLADRIAERVSQGYAEYCLTEFGIVLHHNADKTALLGGSADVRFGGGCVTKPVQALVNGRFSSFYDGKPIPVEDIVTTAVREVLDETLVHFDSSTDLRITCRNNMSSSPGFVAGAVREGTRSHWFAPRGKQDVTPMDSPHANDTSCGVGYAPLSKLERFVLGAEDYLQAVGDQLLPGAVGTDIKVMAARMGTQLLLTAAVPVIDAEVADLAEYLELVSHLRVALAEEAERWGYQPEVIVNGRDKPEIPELYLTVTGSSIESGDEGVVGRGNRCNGLITPMRLMSIEGACGKNPVYHVGKLYNVVSEQIAQRLHERTGRHVGVTMVSLTGAPLVEPRFVAISHSGEEELPEQFVRSVIDECMADLADTRQRLVGGKIPLF